MIKLIWSYRTKQYLLSIGIFLSFFSSAIGLIISFSIGYFIDHLAGYVSLNLWIMFFIFLILLQAVVQGFSMYTISNFGASVFMNIQKNLFQRLVNMKYSYMSEYPASSWSSHLTTDVLSLRDVLAEKIPEFIVAVVKVGIVIIIMIYLDWIIE